MENEQKFTRKADRPMWIDLPFETVKKGVETEDVMRAYERAQEEITVKLSTRKRHNKDSV